MFGARATRLRFSNRFKLTQSKPFCTNTTNNVNGNNTDKIQSNLTKYDQQYRQLDKLDFMTAAKMLFTDPPKTKKFGIDFHLVQLFFACMPSLAVYLVAQYARHEMRKMDAELEKKKKQEEEEKAKEMELNAAKDKEAGSDPQLFEVKERLDKLEEAVKEIVVESKKQSGSITKNLEDGNEKKHLATSEPGNIQSGSESSNSMENDQLTKQKFAELTPNLDQGKESGSAPIPNSSQQVQKDKTQNGGPSQDA